MRLTEGQTDRQTDGRTDRILIVRPRLHSMQRGKNGPDAPAGHIDAIRCDESSDIRRTCQLVSAAHRSAFYAHSKILEIIVSVAYSRCHIVISLYCAQKHKSYS